jgi:two-component system nitrate/nitrite response regulator NarP
MIVEDHPIFMNGLIGFLSESGHQIACAATDCADALAKLPTAQVDAAIIDVHLPDGNGVDLVAAIRDQGHAIATILLSGDITAQESRRALAHGVNGMLLKDCEPAIVLRCIESVLSGHRWIDDKIMDCAMAVGSTPTTYITNPSNLTRAEKAIADQVVSGLRNREVASMLGLSEGTVKVHVHNIFRKLGVNSRTALAYRLREI